MQEYRIICVSVNNTDNRFTCTFEDCHFNPNASTYKYWTAGSSQTYRSSTGPRTDHTYGTKTRGLSSNSLDLNIFMRSIGKQEHALYKYPPFMSLQQVSDADSKQKISLLGPNPYKAVGP